MLDPCFQKLMFFIIFKMQSIEAMKLSLSESLVDSYIPGSILCTLLRCRFKLEDWLQQNSHKWQANGFSPV